MSLMLVGLAGLLQPADPPSVVRPPTGAPNAAAYCDLLERKTDRNAVELHDLATCLFRGEVRPRDLSRARALYAQAIELGFARSMCALGNMMIDGLGGDRDIAGGLALCRRAAEAGEAQAQTDLGNYLLMGAVVPRDAVEARNWYTRAAEQGQANAAFVLGQVYWNGDGVTKDNAEAARWWRIAHEGGRPDAAYLLAREAFVRMVRGVPRPEDADPAIIAEALRWFDLAAQTDPNPANREDAVRSAGMLRQFQALARQRRGQ
jgi:TPR repeat protein